MEELEIIKRELEEIKERNRKVEVDKKWETSLLRKFAICILTYIVVIIYSAFINRSGSVFLNSLVPVIGFFLSTLSMDLIRKVWMKKQMKKA